jgi:4-diphosphocytidyl-2-C-methyl-D-erythritol kinase
VQNDLQEVVLARHPEVLNALKSLQKVSPAMMTGSGACVFSRFGSEASAREVAARLQQDFQVVVARGLS